ncbi:MAG: VCBS repeat-containing protein, partial [Planctomycetota bacterium]|nr:VCBS repeat-containing protein [Planctomycetota bacterium]
MLDACDLLPSLSFGTIRANRLRERTRPWLIQAADFDGDGRPDVAFVDAEGGFDRPARTLIVLAGRDGGAGSELRFEPLARLELDFLPTQMLAADLDGDGLSDLAFLAAARVRVLLNVGGGQLAEGGEFRLDPGRPTTPLIASDLDLDGDHDLLTASRSTGRVLVLRLAVRR